MIPNSLSNFVVILDRIRSAYNVGSIFRSADSAGVDGIILTGYTACPPHRKVLKTSLGSEESVPWIHLCNGEEATSWIKGLGFSILAFETGHQSQSLFNSKFILPTKTCIIFGNEVDGIKPEIIDLADKIIHIPHMGHKDSLNVAVAAGVGLFEIARQKGNFAKK